ncbi:unnamed protein product [Rotaria sordida]|uniref:Uncharacterized protein n=1 Tax=Rotaria sordida TaxID=392033 RepID=A0A813UXE0_9BILA|nr:unnamed protein product [Rotaria sordida]
MTTTTEQTVINMEQKPAVAHTLVINEPINSQQVSLETVIANEPKNLLATSVEKVAVTDVTTAKPVEADNLIVDDPKNVQTTESDKLPSSGASKKALNKKLFGSGISLATVVLVIIPRKSYDFL